MNKKTLINRLTLTSLKGVIPSKFVTEKDVDKIVLAKVKLNEFLEWYSEYAEEMAAEGELVGSPDVRGVLQRIVESIVSYETMISFGIEPDIDPETRTVLVSFWVGDIEYPVMIEVPEEDEAEMLVKKLCKSGYVMRKVSKDCYALDEITHVIGDAVSLRVDAWVFDRNDTEPKTSPGEWALLNAIWAEYWKLVRASAAKSD